MLHSSWSKEKKAPGIVQYCLLALAKKQIQKKVSLLTFAKNYDSLFKQQSSPESKDQKIIMFVARFIHDLYNYTWNALRASSFYDNDVYFIFIRVSFRIRIKTLICFVPVMALILRIFFLFRWIIPAR